MPQSILDSVTPQRQLALLRQTKEVWENTYWQARLNHQIHKDIGSGVETLATFIKDMELAQKAVDIITKQINELITPEG